ncbi:nucleotidyltransferase family protein [Pontibacter sp. G13]|uniref:nucleotidyltransferase family protein n=1 Tax=Pontibacter sp. G13 TaxID=3074898 RepID=UPI00288ACCA9|nr:nucleotidyltransferase family protein [Pontibacter sp. G13]WNJ15911.1 nucleotidyltransferase family protein [Pontibacter sp. G13]
MIFAAGLGTRLRPLTNDRPKALVELHGKPLLEWVILKLKDAGIQEFVVNVHHFGDLVIEFLHQRNHFGVNIQISDERAELLETGGGIKFAAPLLRGDEPILIHNVDILSDLDVSALVRAHRSSDSIATLAMTERSTSRYLLVNEQDEIVGWKNVNTGQIRDSRIENNPYKNLAFSGIHVISPRLLDQISEDGKFSIIDTYLRLAKTEKLVAFRHNADRWVDVGKPENFPKAEKLLEDLYHSLV